MTKMMMDVVQCMDVAAATKQRKGKGMENGNGKREEDTIASQSVSYCSERSESRRKAAAGVTQQSANDAQAGRERLYNSTTAPTRNTFTACFCGLVLVRWALT